MAVRLAIVVSDFNEKITSKMLETAMEHAIKLKAKVSFVMHVPGAFDMPIAVEALLKKKQIDAVVTLGAVIKGDTKHDEIVAENAARLIADLSLKYGKPVSLGITGPGMTAAQARDRAVAVPVRAIRAAVSMALRLGKLEKTAAATTPVILRDDSAYNN